MFRESFWWPGEPKRLVVLVAVLVMVVLHQSEVVGLTDSTTLIFGWIPIQLTYDALFNLFGVVILYAMYRLAPNPPANMVEDEPETGGSKESTEVRADGR